MSYSLDIELEGLPPMNSADGHHWRVRRRMRMTWEEMVAAHCVGKKPAQPLSKARVAITRFSSREPDFENKAQGGKFLIDGLVKCGVLEDDKPSVIGQPEYPWVKTAPRKGRVRIQVWADTGVEIGPRVQSRDQKTHEGRR